MMPRREILSSNDLPLEVGMTLGHLIALIVVGLVCAWLAERVLRQTVPYGWIGAAVAGFIGAWLAVDVLHISIANQVALEPIPLIPAFLGALLVVFVFSLAGRGRFGRGFRK
jgi:uncharacterized membrane protein YeaQ/YmgE (transglycosylase-associated protein family)